MVEGNKVLPILSNEFTGEHVGLFLKEYTLFVVDVGPIQCCKPLFVVTRYLMGVLFPVVRLLLIGITLYFLIGWNLWH